MTEPIDGASPVPLLEVSAEARARIVLSHLGEPGDVALGAAVDDLSAQEVLAGIREGTLSSPAAARQLENYRARLPRADADLDLEVAARAGLRVLVPGDDQWPTPLDDLGPARPLLLWVSGAADLAEVTRRAVAVVGARACTAYGQSVAAEFAAGLAERGWTVVSGGAFGIDAAAHRGAMAVDGTTLAVMASGVDVPYPVAHTALLDAVRRGGAVVSELPPGSRPTKRRFLDRNRLIAALSRGTVVVEAALRSGARNTASHADALSRPVMAVPGPVTSAFSAGSHELIRSYGAHLVTDASDVLEVVGDLGDDAAAERRGELRPEDALSPEVLRVLEAMPARRWATTDEVVVAAGLAPPTVLRALGTLCSSQLAEGSDGVWRLVR